MGGECWLSGMVPILSPFIQGFLGPIAEAVGDELFKSLCAAIDVGTIRFKNAPIQVQYESSYAKLKGMHDQGVDPTSKEYQDAKTAELAALAAAASIAG